MKRLLVALTAVVTVLSGCVSDGEEDTMFDEDMGDEPMDSPQDPSPTNPTGDAGAGSSDGSDAGSSGDGAGSSAGASDGAGSSGSDGSGTTGTPPADTPPQKNDTGTEAEKQYDADGFEIFPGDPGYVYPSGATDDEAPPADDLPPADQPLPRVTNGPAGDTDLDGIPDVFEQELKESGCVIAGRSCQDLGIKAPEVGVRDYIMIEFSRSGTDQDWRIDAALWDQLMGEMRRLGITPQRADLGMRDDINPKAEWDNSSKDQRFWFAWITYDAADDETAGWNEYDWVNMMDHAGVGQQRSTMLHEIYHSFLGDLNGGYSVCENAEAGGKSHSNDPKSVIFTGADCFAQADPGYYRLSAAEEAELKQEPIESFRLMNRPDWTTGTVA